MITEFTPEHKESFPCLELVFETPQELDIFKTMVGYYPYDNMEKLRKEYGNRFPNVKTADVIAIVEKISSSIK